MAGGDVAKVIGKKLVRAAYYFVAEQDGSWYTNLSQCAEAANRYYSNQSDDIELAYQYALGNLISKTEAFELYERLSKELIREQVNRLVNGWIKEISPLKKLMMLRGIH